MNALIPVLHGIIDRRMLVNFRVNAEVAAKLLPPPFRPKLVRGWAMAGICLIRLKNMRPSGFPAAMGLDSENAAHRIAVEWNEDATVREGVFIPRRDTSSNLQAFFGGRVFSGVHNLADFDVNETGDDFSFKMRSQTGGIKIGLKARLTNSWNPNSIFSSLPEASDFFARGAIGYSTACDAGCWDGLELHTDEWKVAPLDVAEVESSFFEDRVRFPIGSIEFDCALLMRGIKHEWRMSPQLRQPEGKI